MKKNHANLIAAIESVVKKDSKRIDVDCVFNDELKNCCVHRCVDIVRIDVRSPKPKKD